jgi:AcrR family transcriptional regulator
MKKGESTRLAILETGLHIAARDGLEGITIGGLADSIGMSKSGVFSHFGSREELQIALLKAYESRFVEEILFSQLKVARGLPRLTAIVEAWLKQSAREATEGCIWISGATEYDNRPGPVRDTLVGMVNSWQKELSKAIVLAIEEGHLKSSTDAEQLVFEIYGVILVLHHDAKLLKSANAVVRARGSLDRLFNSYQSLGVQVRPQFLDALSEPLAPRPVSAPSSSAQPGSEATQTLVTELTSSGDSL